MSLSNTMSYRQRLAILAGVTLTIIIGLLIMEPVPQDPDYHLFADTRAFFGIPNFNDVMSNAGFALVGALGMLAVWGSKRRQIFLEPVDSRPYVIFFVGVALVSLGSGYYHWEPTNERLLWDRVPMTFAFMAFASAFIADRIDANAGNGWVLPILLLVGVSSLFYWVYTEDLGRGDLRPYAFVQFSPVVALPFVLWLFPKHHYVPNRYIGWVVFWYGLSKVFEHFDGEIFDGLNRIVSGHSLKHLAAAVSVYVVLRMLTIRISRST